MVKVNQNQDAALFPLIIFLLIQLLNPLRFSSPTVPTLPPNEKFHLDTTFYTNNISAFTAGVELAAPENGSHSQFIAQEEDGQQKIALQRSSQPIHEDDNFNANLGACCCDSQ